MKKDIEWAKKQIILEITESTDRQNPQFYANFYRFSAEDSHL